MSNRDENGEAAPPGPSAEELRWLSEQARTRQAPVGASFSIEAPPSLVARVSLAPVEAVHLPDGRFAILLKTVVGWKDNFCGFLYVSGAIAASEMKNDRRGRPFISLPAPPPWEELYVASIYDDHLAEVFFDLN